jgi:hypothetical protein
MAKAASLLFLFLLSFHSLQAFQEAKAEASPLLGMVLTEEKNSFDLLGTIDELGTQWKLDVKSEEDSDNQAAVLLIDNYRIVLSEIPVAIPGSEVEKAAQFNYLWENAAEESAQHQGHIIVSITNPGEDPIAENLLFSKVVMSVMNNSSAIGMYMGQRTLVLRKDLYEYFTASMSTQELPLYLWLYFGLRELDGKRSIYTYGLSEFGKQEMEILDSDRSFEELSSLMYDMAHYVLAFDVELKTGETIGGTAQQKLPITESPGRFVKGNTLKIAY